LPERESRSNQTAPEEPLVGLAEVAELLGVTKRTATTYSARDDFPKPLQRLAATPVWRRAEVESWAKQVLPLTKGRPPRRS
jgi:predicted DNA-binding transcriptional regulator AlpA